MMITKRNINTCLVAMIILVIGPRIILIRKVVLLNGRPLYMVILTYCP
jgi:hypothetical protein